MCIDSGPECFLKTEADFMEPIKTLGKTGMLPCLQGSSKAGLKRAFLVNHYSCCTYANNQAKFKANKLLLL